MPAIVLFRRRTMLGGDDLQPAALLGIFLRLMQLTTLLGPVVQHVSHDWRRRSSSSSSSSSGHINEDGDCRYARRFIEMLALYTAAAVVYNIGNCALEYHLVMVSSLGAPTQTEPRNSLVARLLEIKLVHCSVLLFVIWLLGLGALSLAPLYYKCSKDQQENQWVEEQNDDDDDDAIAIAARRRFVLWWIALAILLCTQISEVLFSWLYLFSLCRQPVADHEHALYDHTSDMPYNSTDEAAVMASHHRHHHELVEAMWADRCARTCDWLGRISCYMFGGREVLMGHEKSFGDVARALADYFESHGVLDVVPSDIVIGFVVLQRLQKSRIYHARMQVMRDLECNNRSQLPRTSPSGRHDSGTHIVGENNGEVGLRTQSTTELGDDLLVALQSPVSSSGGSRARPSVHSIYRFDPDGNYEQRPGALLSRANYADLTALEEGARYAKYALAIYTWVLYLYEHPVTGVLRLAARTSCNCRCFGNNRRYQHHVYSGLGVGGDTSGRTFGVVDGDNMCETNKTALLMVAHLSASELVYAQLSSGFNNTPYAILLDHDWRSVVVTVRGTFSLEDCVTDVLIDPESLEQLGRDHGFDATDQHCHGGVLAHVRNVYRDLQRHGLLDRLLLGDGALHPDYSLRLTGHSLGAATCTVLSYMLRSRFPTLRVISYSPPGCCFSWEMATNCKEWCTSFVLDSDIVPRLSFQSMESLRDQVLDVVGRLRVPKVEVAQRLLGTTAILGLPRETKDAQAEIVRHVYEILCPVDDIPSSEYAEQLQRFKDIQRERRESRGERRAINLYPPGSIVHLVKTGERASLFQGMAKCATCCTSNAGFKYTPMWINNDDLNEIVVSTTMATDHFPNRMAHMLVDVANDFGLDQRHFA